MRCAVAIMPLSRMRREAVFEAHHVIPVATAGSGPAKLKDLALPMRKLSSAAFTALSSLTADGSVFTKREPSSAT